MLLLLGKLVLEVEGVDLETIELLLEHLWVKSLLTSSWHNRRRHGGKLWTLQSTCRYERPSLLVLVLLSFLLLPGQLLLEARPWLLRGGDAVLGLLLGLC